MILEIMPKLASFSSNYENIFQKVCESEECNYICVRFREKWPNNRFLNKIKSGKVNTLSYRTSHAKPEEVKRKWHLIDAEGQVVGRMCSQIAHILRGKNKVDFTPHVDNGDYVIVINAEKSVLQARK